MEREIRCSTTDRRDAPDDADLVRSGGRCGGGGGGRRRGGRGGRGSGRGGGRRCRGSGRRSRARHGAVRRELRLAARRRRDDLGRGRGRREVEWHADAARHRLACAERGRERPLSNRDHRCLVEVCAARLEHVDLRHVPVDVDGHGDHHVAVLSRSQSGRRILRIDVRDDRRRGDRLALPRLRASARRDGEKACRDGDGAHRDDRDRRPPVPAASFDGQSVRHPCAARRRHMT